MNNEEIRVEVNEEVIELKVEVEETIVEVKAIGEKGQQGPQGQTGATPNISVKSTTTLPAGSNATVELDASSTPENPKFNFGIPKGDTGEVSEEELDEVDEKVIATRNELNRVRDVILETGTASNSNITLNDSVMSELQALNVEGVCKQTNTTGKNKLSITTFTDNSTTKTINGVTATINNDGSITLSGTSNANTTLFLTKNDFTLENGSGYFWCNSPSANCRLECVVITDGTTRYLNSYGTPNTFNISSSFSYSNIYILISSGTTTNVTLKPMIANGTYTSYEPYTGGQPSPNPDYPQPISVIENSIKLTSCGKNLCRLDNANISGTGYSYSCTNQEFDLQTTSHNGNFDLTGGIRTGTWAQNYADATDYHLTPVNQETYTLAFIGTYTASSTNTTQLSIVTNQRKVNYYFTTNTSNIRFKIELQENEYIKQISIWTNGVISSIELKGKLLLLKGDYTSGTFPSYEPYESTSITASLGNEFMGKVRTKKDYLEVAYNQQDGQYHLLLNKFIGKVVLNGSESGWFENNKTNTATYFISNVFVGKTNYIYSGLLCNLLVNNSCYSADIEGFYQNKTSFVFSIRKDRLANTNFQTARQFLVDNNCKIYYELATPYVVDLGVIDNTLLSYNNITHIFTDSALQPIVNVVYYRDFSTTVQNLQINVGTLKNELISIESRLSALEGN